MRERQGADETLTFVRLARATEPQANTTGGKLRTDLSGMSFHHPFPGVRPEFGDEDCEDPTSLPKPVPLAVVAASRSRVSMLGLF